MEWLLYERGNAHPVMLIEDSDPDEVVATIARSIVKCVADPSIMLLDCNYRHPRLDCRCLACEVARGNHTAILIGNA